MCSAMGTLFKQIQSDLISYQNKTSFKKSIDLNFGVILRKHFSHLGCVVFYSIQTKMVGVAGGFGGVGDPSDGV